MRIRKILWPTDFSACSSAALGHAIYMAHRHSAALDLLHVVVLHDHDPFHPTFHFPDREAIFQRLGEIAADPRLRTARDRCDLYYRMAQQRRGFTRDDYPESACADYPYDAHPWAGG